MAAFIPFVFTSVLAAALVSGFRIPARNPRSTYPFYGSPQIPSVFPYQSALAPVYPQPIPPLNQPYLTDPQCTAANRFRCPSGECIPRRNLCDGQPDCRRGVDEQMFLCRYRRPYQSQMGCSPQSHFQCRNNNCLPRSAMCNGLDECGDMSDESSCGQLSYGPQNPWLYGGYNNPQLPIPPVSQSSLVCDSSQQFTCYFTIPPYNFKIVEKCIPQTYKCNGINDCADLSDELNCSNQTRPPVNYNSCGQNEFRCHNGQCIANDQKCDGRSDCADRSDEMSCPS